MVRSWRLPSQLNVQRLNIPTINASTLGSRATSSLPFILLILPLHPVHRTRKIGVHIRSVKQLNLMRNAARCGRCIVHVLLSVVFFVLDTLGPRSVRGAISPMQNAYISTFHHQKAVQAKGLDTLLDQARQENPLKEPPPIPSSSSS